MVEFKKNSIDFVQKNPYFINLEKKDIEAIIQKEVDLQLNKLNTSGSPCGDAFLAAHDVCLENLLVSGGAVIVSGFFTFGIGTFIGGGVAGIQFLRCSNTADENYYACLEAEQGN